MTKTELQARELLAAMEPRLWEERYVFCSVPEPEAHRLAATARALFVEAEGVTLVLATEVAEAEGHAGGPVFRMVTLTVASSLEAVGFLAAVTAALAELGIAANAFAGYHHDHLFVPEGRADDALRALQALQRSVAVAPRTGGADSE